MADKPKITIMGEEIPWDSVPEAQATDMADYFKPVKLSPKAINEASKIVPIQHWQKEGIYVWLQGRANHVFAKLSSVDLTVGKLGCMKYFFEYDVDGPVLKTVAIV